MSDELTRISELDPQGDVFKAELRKIREAKTREVAHTIRGLFAIEAAKNFYNGTADFLEAWQETIPIVKPSDAAKYLFKSQPEIFEQVINSMLSVTYTPPSNLKSVLTHLFVLWVHYRTSYEDRITLVDMLIDFSFCKLKACQKIFLQFQCIRANESWEGLKRQVT